MRDGRLAVKPANASTLREGCVLLSSLELCKQRGSTCVALALVCVWVRQPGAAASLGTSISYSQKLQSISFSSHFSEFVPARRVTLGLGARTTVFRSHSASFSTADATETSRGRTETVESGFFSTLSANMMLFAKYQLTDSYQLSVDLDALGFSTGRRASFSNGLKSSTGKPSTLNLLVFDKYDRGTLNSQFLITRKFDNDLDLSFGLAHQFVEYKTDQSFTFENHRYRLKNDGVAVCLDWNFYF